ncbi:hypothetical protein ACFYY2_27390 [Streptomyces sp. NPDC001822]|uniref:hypothetical protein n=1 Tax=Streptomyces sp. NPDC001822 TaxID=3364614 RepID=UPI003690159E
MNDGPDDTPHSESERDGEQAQADEAGVDGAEAAPGTAAEGAAPDGAGGCGFAPGCPEGGGFAPGGAEGGGAAPGGADGGGLPSDGGGLPSGGAGTLTELFGGMTGAGIGAGIGTGGGAVSGGARDGVYDEAHEAAHDGRDMGEAELRLLLRGAVQGLEPSTGTLDHLQRAVPARRARRRQALVGAAAAALLIGTAVPAFVHVANSEGSATASPAIAGHGQQAQGGSGEDAGSKSDGPQSTGPQDSHTEGGGGEHGNSAEPSEGSGPDVEGAGTAGLGDTPGDNAAATACDPGQLGVASAEAGAAGANGTVYGAFKISNVSGSSCSVTTNGTVGFQAAGAADPMKINVVQHIAGDPASGLPDPSLEPGTVVLKPAMAYEVRFAWVPSDTCPTTGGSPSPTPTDGAGGGGDSTGTTAGSAETGTQFGSADEGPADGSIAVTHTPEAGAPTAETTISNACAGTIYRTGVLGAS